MLDESGSSRVLEPVGWMDRLIELYERGFTREIGSHDVDAEESHGQAVCKLETLGCGSALLSPSPKASEPGELLV